MQSAGARLARALAAAGLVAMTGTSLAAPEPQGVARLAWLAGCWAGELGEPGTAEHWMPPAGATMLGTGRTVKAGRTTEYEFLRIHESADGKLLYTARPSGQPEATFTQLRLGETEVVFENLAHDFPQRVIYRRAGDARLLASIEGMRQGAIRTIEFPMKRVACDR